MQLPEQSPLIQKAMHSEVSSSSELDLTSVDPDTEVRFPITLPASSSFPSLHLVGLGVRKVSFLRVKVYSAGFYFEEGQIKGLHHVPGWHVSPRPLARRLHDGSQVQRKIEADALYRTIRLNTSSLHLLNIPLTHWTLHNSLARR